MYRSLVVLLFSLFLPAPAGAIEPAKPARTVQLGELGALGTYLRFSLAYHGVQVTAPGTDGTVVVSLETDDEWVRAYRAAKHGRTEDTRLVANDKRTGKTLVTYSFRASTAEPSLRETADQFAEKLARKLLPGRDPKFPR